MLHCAHPSNLRSISEHPNDLTLPLDLELFRFSSTLKSMFPASFQIRHTKPGDSGCAVPHRGEEPDAAHLVPFGPYGGGQINRSSYRTGHRNRLTSAGSAFAYPGSAPFVGFFAPRRYLRTLTLVAPSQAKDYRRRSNVIEALKT